VRDALEAIRDDMFQAFDPEGFRIELRRELSVGDGAVVEYSAHGRTRDGRAYDNDYVMCITVRDARVTSVRPYTDTLHLTRVLMNGEQGDSP
jgi:ketosteroid isomerase-like protein